MTLRRATILDSATAALFGASQAIASTPSFRPCPAASIVSLTLRQAAKAPQVATAKNSETCTYPGTASIPAFRTVITFQNETVSDFALFEKIALSHSPGIKMVHGLGRAA